MRVTPGFRLKAKHVIHAVGPVWQGGNRGEPQLLASAYRHALGARSVAFPAISTGVYRYPLDAATSVAVATVREFLREHAGPKRMIFCCFDERTEAAYRRELTAGRGA